MAWTLVFGKRKAERDWPKLFSALGSDAESRAIHTLTNEVRKREPRNHPLRGSLATGTYEGHELECWEYEVSGGGRIRYLIDDDAQRVIVRGVFFGHPSDTD